MTNNTIHIWGHNLEYGWKNAEKGTQKIVIMK